jgi:excisionase family DNA binding protein
MWQPPRMAVRARALEVESTPGRQLELLDRTPADRAADTAVVSVRTADRSAVEKAAARNRQLPPLAVSPDEAAAMLGVSRDYFDEHVIGDLRVVRVGRRILVPVAELKRWLTRHAARTGASGRA